MDFSIVKAIAGQEFRIHIRSKWTLLFGIVFAALALGISYFGMITAGLIGFESFTRTSASLLNLVIYLVPLMSLTLGALSFTDARGADELLYSQPVERREILIGKVAGLFLSIAAATCFGFGAAGVVISFNTDASGSLGYGALVGLTLLLALVFLSLSTLVAVKAQTRGRAFGYALLLWFAFLLFYDLLVMGLAFTLQERPANLLIFVSLFGNPADMVRVAALIAVGGTTIFGAAGALLVKFLGGAATGFALILAVLLAWVSVPLAVAGRLLKKKDI